MAIARGAGTEIIRSAMFEDVAGVGTKDLIIGEQHHIYTVLSVVMYTVNAGCYINLNVTGYDSNGGTTAQEIVLLSRTIVAGETFVWNDKFSFNGYEPTNFTGPMDDTTKQNAIADQGSSVAQKLRIYLSNASADLDIIVTYIDQNNA